MFLKNTSHHFPEGSKTESYGFKVQKENVSTPEFYSLTIKQYQNFPQQSRAHNVERTYTFSHKNKSFGICSSKKP